MGRRLVAGCREGIRGREGSPTADQWYDAAPSGTASHTYTIRALADAAGVNRVN